MCETHEEFIEKVSKFPHDEYFLERMLSWNTQLRKVFVRDDEWIKKFEDVKEE